MRFKILIGSLLFWLCLFSANKIFAASLYVATAPVPSRSDEVLQAQLPKMLQSVLVKASGNVKVLETPALASMLTNAAKYLREFSYQDNPDKANPFLLIVRFNAKAIKRELKKNHLSVWFKHRPMILLWIVVQDNQGKRFVDNIQDQVLINTVKAAAEERGLPILLATPSLQINFEDVWQLQVPKIKDASRNYLIDDILIITFDIKTPDTVISNWTLLNNDSKWALNGSKIFEIIPRGMNNVSTTLVRRFSAMKFGKEITEKPMCITNLKGAAAYNKLLTYLRKLPNIDRVQTDLIEGDKINLTLSFRGGLAQLVQMINLSHFLKLSQPIDKDKNILYYEYVSNPY